ncbi:MAG: Glutathione-dependent formaldehyde-activating enzyme [Hydrocarboniphaga sp.]|nr:Glutathione-dependent formaldehyde-activating enzyme [Hydrocarboniphaga sp.]
MDTQEAPVSRSGQCLCGGVRYQLEAEPLSFMFCHCRDCQTVSGGGPAAIVMLPKPAFRLLQGTLKTYSKRSDRGNMAHRRFCAECGSQILSELDARPRFVFIKAGTLDDPASLTPRANLWIRSAQPWSAMDRTLKQFETEP